MIYIYIGVFIFLMVYCVSFRVAVLHPFKTIGYGVRDAFDYVRYKKKRNLKTGELVAFVGLFGKGKTLSAVHHVVKLYRQYNNKRIYDSFRKKWVTQRVFILSNVDLSIPYVHLDGLKQIVELANNMHTYDSEHDTLTCILVLGDEFSVQLNSRTFKTNIDPLFLNTLLTCRHHHISIFYTSQRFNHVDALLRQVTSYVISCNKCWRFMVHEKFDAYQLEQATDVTLVRPLVRFGWFITNKDFNAYDTLACVDNLSKSCLEGDMLSSEEILNNIAAHGAEMEGVTTPSRKYVRKSKKIRK